jgi:hypothetical protein
MNRRRELLFQFALDVPLGMYRVNSTQCSYKTDDDEGKPPSTLLLGLQKSRRYDGPHYG